eukprot:g2978.t1
MPIEGRGAKTVALCPVIARWDSDVPDLEAAARDGCRPPDRWVEKEQHYKQHRILLIWRRVGQCYDDIAAYEAAHQIEFDYLLRLRADVYYLSMFRPRAWFQRNAVALPTGMQAHPRVFSDVMGACHRPVCESYWKLAHNTLFSDEAQRRCGEAGGDWERALGHGVGDSSGELMTNRLRFLNVTIVQPLLLFTVLRADGLECYRLDDTADDGVRPRRWFLLGICEKLA